MRDFATPSARWQALVSRDPNADGRFVYCVRTTGIYCRPICKARLARRSNVGFYEHADQAESAGYRACKRCRPQLASYTPEADKIRNVCGVIRDLPFDAPLPRLEDLATMVGLTKHHFHRLFKKVTGLTPKEYALVARPLPELGDWASSADTSLSCTPATCPTNEQFRHVESMAKLDTFAEACLPYAFDKETSLFRQKVSIGSEGQSRDTSVGLVSPNRLGRGTTVYHAEVQTTFGVLSVAFVDGVVCKLNLSASTFAATEELRQQFPELLYMVSKIEPASALSAKVDEIVEALERPSGKAILLPLSLTLALASSE